MKKGPLNPKYIRIEVQNRSFNHEQLSRIDQVVGIEDSTQVIGLDNTIEMVVLEENFIEGYGRQNSRGGYRNDKHNDYNRGREQVKRKDIYKKL